jgi:hypothetical protein
VVELIENGLVNVIVSVEDITSWYVLIEKVTGGAETEIVAVAHVGASVAVPATTYVAVNF